MQEKARAYKILVSPWYWLDAVPLTAQALLKVMLRLFVLLQVNVGCSPAQQTNIWP